MEIGDGHDQCGAQSSREHQASDGELPRGEQDEEDPGGGPFVEGALDLTAA